LEREYVTRLESWSWAGIMKFNNVLANNVEWFLTDYFLCEVLVLFSMVDEIVVFVFGAVTGTFGRRQLFDHA
jgi:hypothetical protein